MWLDRLTCVTQPERKKICALALSSLVASGAEVVNSRIYGVLLAVTETLNDITKSEEETGNIVE